MRNLVFVLIVAACISCNKDEVIYDQVQPVRNGEWSYGNDLSFEFEVADTARLYRLLLYVEFSTDYQWQNLYTNITTTFPNDSLLVDLVSFELASKTGMWYGDCDQDICAVNIPMQERVKFPFPGTYKLNFEQYMREEHLAGINAVGVKLVVPDQN